MRTGKIDIMDAISLQAGSSICRKQTLKYCRYPFRLESTITMDPRNDMKPFNDIRVREAMQMAIDLPTIANTYYGGTADRGLPR